jgi:hypothetical protein
MRGFILFYHVSSEKNGFSLWKLKSLYQNFRKSINADFSSEREFLEKNVFNLCVRNPFALTEVDDLINQINDFSFLHSRDEFILALFMLSWDLLMMMMGNRDVNMFWMWLVVMRSIWDLFLGFVLRGLVPWLPARSLS